MVMKKTNDKVECLRKMGYTVKHDPHGDEYTIQIRIGDFGYMKIVTGTQMEFLVVEEVVDEMNSCLKKLMKGM